MKFGIYWKIYLIIIAAPMFERSCYDVWRLLFMKMSPIEFLRPDPIKFNCGTVRYGCHGYIALSPKSVIG